MANVDVNFAPIAYYEADPNGCTCSGSGNASSTTSIGAVFAASAADSKLGADIDGIFDTGAMLNLATGLKNVGNAMCRRLITPRGALFYDPEYGFDVRAFLNMGFTPEALASLQSQISAELEKDERVQSADVTVDTDINSMTMKITIIAALAEGDYKFIISVDKATAQLLQAQELS